MGASDEPDPGAFERRFDEALAILPNAEPAVARHPDPHPHADPHPHPKPPPAAGTEPPRLIVAFSGGLDSTLLLHALKRARPEAVLLAVHIDHGLHGDSAEWMAHCETEARSLGVGFLGRAVEVSSGAGDSLEAGARDARYRALAEIAAPGDIVLTAHHADDQLETLLLRLLRGAGVRGLTAIHALAPFGDAWLARPLLDFTRAEIEAEARRLGLRWLEDPSNRDPRFDRNFLRTECLPQLLQRWPSAGRVATRVARQMAEAESVLAEVAAQDLAAVDQLERIPVGLLSLLSEPRLNNALRHAARMLDLPVPSTAQLTELKRMLTAREDAEALVRWPGAEARLYRQHLYLGRPIAPAIGIAMRIDPDTSLSLSGGELRLVPAAAGIPDRWARAGLMVSLREGGERFRPAGSAHHKSLKQWFQEQGIVPWMRGAIPLLHHDDELVAIADLCLAADLPNAPGDAPFWRPVWIDRPPLH